MKSFTSLIVLFLLACSALPLFSQSEAVISYAVGNGFQIVRDGRPTSYNISAEGVIGLSLFPDDVILTDDGSFVEIQLNKGSGVIKLAENTTFTITSLDESGGGVFKVSYGRIRLKIASLLGNSKLWVTGYDTVAGVRGTDYGYDLFYDINSESGERQTAVYCFEGEVDVLQYDRETVSKIELMGMDPFVLSADKMVKTTSNTPEKKLKSTDIDDEIRSYWSAHPIFTPFGSQALAQDGLEVSDNLNLNSSLDTVKGTYETGGKIVFAMGVGMITIAGLLKAFLPDDPSTAGISTGLLLGGAVSTVTGGGMMIYSVSLP